MPHQSKGEPYPVTSLCVAPTDLKFASGAEDAAVKVWDFRRLQGPNPEPDRKFDGHGGNVMGVDWHPRLGLIVSGSDDAMVKLWDPRVKEVRKGGLLLLVGMRLTHDWAMAPRLGLPLRPDPFGAPECCAPTVRSSCSDADHPPSTPRRSASGPSTSTRPASTLCTSTGMGTGCSLVAKTRPAASLTSGSTSKTRASLSVPEPG